MPYAVEPITFSTGENFIHLIDLDTGIPHRDSTVFNMLYLRGRGLATNTIEQSLRAIKICLIVCEMLDISLYARLQEGQLFKAGEVDALLRVCRVPMEQIQAYVHLFKQGSSGTSGKRVHFLRRSHAAPEVSNTWIARRIRCIRNYIDWLFETHIARLTPQHAHYATLSAQRVEMFKKLTASTPVSKGRNVVNQRTSLSNEQQAALWLVIESNSPANPWVGGHCRVRNALIVRLFMMQGLRRGELAGIKVRDIDFRANTLLVRRRADDIDDPRSVQPNAKTLDRVLPLSNDLVKRLQQYILVERKRFKGASKHGFLFVANGGRPIGLRAINKIFEKLADRCAEFDGEISPHILRHTFNDNFSDVMDEHEIPEAIEVKLRSKLNGWKPTSGTALIYTRRTTQRRASAASLAMQEKQVIKPIYD